MEARRTVRELLVSHADGEIMALWAAPGQFLTVGTRVAQIREGERESLKAIVRVAPRVAQRIEPGMRASVEIAMPGEATRVMNGEVALMTEEPSGNSDSNCRCMRGGLAPIWASRWSAERGRRRSSNRALRPEARMRTRPASRTCWPKQRPGNLLCAESSGES